MRSLCPHGSDCGGGRCLGEWLNKNVATARHQAVLDAADCIDDLVVAADEAEITAIERVIAGVRRTGARAHILHLSSAAALPALRAARTEGLPITVETCPHYLTIAEEQIPDGATQFKCCPPIRDEANRDALWQALIDGAVFFCCAVFFLCFWFLLRASTST